MAERIKLSDDDKAKIIDYIRTNFHMHGCIPTRNDDYRALAFQLPVEGNSTTSTLRLIYKIRNVSAATVSWVLQTAEWPSYKVMRINKQIECYHLSNLYCNNTRRTKVTANRYIQLSSRILTTCQSYADITQKKRMYLSGKLRCMQTHLRFELDGITFCPSIDRIDSDNPIHNDENVQLVCEGYNKLKGADTDAEAKRFIKAAATSLRQYGDCWMED